MHVDLAQVLVTLLCCLVSSMAAALAGMVITVRVLSRLITSGDVSARLDKNDEEHKRFDEEHKQLGDQLHGIRLDVNELARDPR